METFVTEQAARATAEEAVAARHQEELDCAVTNSMAKVMTDKVARAASELASAVRHQQELNRALAESMPSF